jgi:hypothetical protein
MSGGQGDIELVLRCFPCQKSRLPSYLSYVLEHLRTCRIWSCSIFREITAKFSRYIVFVFELEL